MLSKDTKKRIDDARDILVGQLPLPTDQIELITIALIYKFMDDQDRELEDIGLPKSFFIKGLESYSWTKLISNEISVAQKVQLFIDAIEAFQKPENNLPLLFREIFSNTFLKFRDGATLEKFLKIINGFRYDHSEELGNAFEYLLMKMGSQGANGQFRTPRNIIDFLVEVVNPDKTDTILDPACGTGGFLVSAFRHILRRYTTDYEDRTDVSLNSYEMPEEEKVRWGDKLTSPERQALGRHIEGYDITPMMQRLARVNLYLHEFKEPKIHDYDTLSRDERWKDKFDCILANPPFMTPKGGITPHQRFRIRANKAEVLFMDYIIEHLSVNGKAGVIVPEGIIFQNSGDYVELRKWLVEEAGLWAVVSLPANVFQPYSGVKTSIVFIDRQVARTRNEVILMKIENDGFSLNTNRTPIKKNDLPEALRLLELGKQDVEKLKNSPGTHPLIKQMKVQTREDFARLDAYKAATDARYFYDREWKTLTAALEKLDAMLEKKKIEPKKYQEQREKAETEFLTKTGLAALPTDDEDAAQCFENYLKEPAIHYGTLADDWETLKLSNDLKKHLDAQREYNLSFDKQNSSSAKSSKSDIFNLKKIGEVCDLINGRAFKPTEWVEKSESALPIIRIQNLNNEKADFNYFSGEVQEKNVVRKGDLLFSWSGSRGTSFGAHIWKGEKAVLNQHIFKIEHGEDVLRTYLYYILNQAVEEIEENLHGGVGLVHITKGNLEKIQIPLPPLLVQAEIVAEIEQYQKVIDGCNLLIDNYKPVFEVKEEWEKVKLGEVLNFVSSGSTPLGGKEIYTDEGVLFIRSQNVLKGECDFSDAVFIPEDVHAEMTRSQVKKFDVFLNITGASIGRCAMMFEEREANVNQHVAILRPKNDRLANNFLVFLLNSAEIQKRIDEVQSGGTRQALNYQQIKDLEIPLPSLEEQAQIVSELEADMAVVNGAKRLREKMQAKINGVIAKVWG